MPPSRSFRETLRFDQNNFKVGPFGTHPSPLFLVTRFKLIAWLIVLIRLRDRRFYN